jgi:hypothetical protein
MGEILICFREDTGSIAPLAIGLAGILLATACTFMDVGSLMLFQQRETQLAEALALAVAEEEKVESGRLEIAAEHFAAEANIPSAFEVRTRDGQTVEAKVCGEFLAPIAIPFIDIGGAREVCGEAKARAL